MLIVEDVMGILTSVLRYALPVGAVIVIFTCVISLFRNRPRVHKMAQLTDENNDSVIDINHWETSIGKSKANDIVLPLPSVSRFHAVIAKKSRDWVVTDTFSKNGRRCYLDRHSALAIPVRRRYFQFHETPDQKYCRRSYGCICRAGGRQEPQARLS